MIMHGRHAAEAVSLVTLEIARMVERAENPTETIPGDRLEFSTRRDKHGQGHPVRQGTIHATRHGEGSGKSGRRTVGTGYLAVDCNRPCLRNQDTMNNNTKETRFILT